MTLSPPPALEDGPRLRASLLACLALPSFVEEVAAAAPFADADAVVAAADAATTDLTREDVDLALADHPRIGEKHAGAGASASFSAQEQAASASADTELATALVRGNAVYEERFGRVFLIRAAGRTRGEIVDELQRRLMLDEDEEAAVAAAELRDITLRRVRASFEEMFAAGTTVGA